MTPGPSPRKRPCEGRQELQPRTRVSQLLADGGLLGPLAWMGGGLVAALGLALWNLGESAAGLPLGVGLLGALAVALVGMVIAAVRLGRQILSPLLSLEGYLGRLSQGEGATALSVEQAGILGGIARDLDSLREELAGLYEDMDDRVARQTMRLAQKTASLNILYDVAAGINQLHDLDALLLRFLRVLKEMVNGRAATLRLTMPEGTQRLVGAIGLDGVPVPAHERLPLALCLCGRALSPGDILCEHPARHCVAHYGRRMYGADEIDGVRVPLRYQEQLLGEYQLFVPKPGVAQREDILELLATIGHHLGMAVAKQRSDEEARRLSILEERAALAHELHDSLAQTLASLRFQVRLLDEGLRGGVVTEAARRDLERLRGGLDEAHTELRDLLTGFRVPLDRRGLIPALEQLSQRLAQETGVHVFLQNECRQVQLAPITEMQLLRVVQEALANIRKHARAQTVRLLLTCRPGGALVLLVEDDGVGFGTPPDDGAPGEHIGLSIMQERARRVGAELRIESEPGEGTRVELVLPVERGGGVARVAG